MSQGNVEYLAKPSAYLQIASLGIVSQFRPIRVSCQLQGSMQQVTLECNLSTGLGYPDLIVRVNGRIVFNKRLCFPWDLKGDELFQCNHEVLHATWVLSKIPMKIKQLAIVDESGAVLAGFP